MPAETTTSIPSFVAALTASSSATEMGPPTEILIMIFLALLLDLTAITWFIPSMRILDEPTPSQLRIRVLNTLAALAAPTVLPATNAAT